VGIVVYKNSFKLQFSETSKLFQNKQDWNVYLIVFFLFMLTGNPNWPPSQDIV